jgi:hypothetical protein
MLKMSFRKDFLKNLTIDKVESISHIHIIPYVENEERSFFFMKENDLLLTFTSSSLNSLQDDIYNLFFIDKNYNDIVNNATCIENEDSIYILIRLDKINDKFSDYISLSEENVKKLCKGEKVYNYEFFNKEVAQALRSGFIGFPNLVDK